ncbi:MAG: CotH kinase family protein [Verrucomicrobiales bacterium]
MGLSTLADGAAIYYTTDGSVPTPSGGTLYSAPVPVAATTVLRAGAFRPGEAPLRIATRTFLFLDDILAQPALPAGYPGTWQPGVAADYAMDASVGTAAEIKAALRALPTVSVVMPIDDLFNPSTDPAVGGMYSNSTIARGREWERRCSAEFFDFPHGQEIQLDCGARIFGNASRATSRSKHNMRLAFRRAYGAPNLEFPVFGGDAHPEKVNGYLLRGQNGDSWFHPAAGQRQEALYIRDQVARSAHAAMDRPETRQDHVHLYLNGLYWGVFNTIERIEDNAMAERFGGADEEWDVIKSSRVAGMEVVSGSLDQWREVQALAEAGVAGDAEYAAIQEFLDLPNMIDFLLVNFYNGNSDWDDNNFQAARRRVPGDKWRFFVWDSERTLLSPTANNTGLNHADRVTRLHTMLRQNAEYRLLFADRIHRHFFNGGILTPDGMRAEFNRWVDFLRGPLLAESARWGDNYRAGNPYTVGGEWQAEVDYMHNTYMAGRTDTVLAQLAAQGLYPAVAPRPSTSMAATSP